MPRTTVADVTSSTAHMVGTGDAWLAGRQALRAPARREHRLRDGSSRARGRVLAVPRPLAAGTAAIGRVSADVRRSLQQLRHAEPVPVEKIVDLDLGDAA